MRAIYTTPNIEATPVGECPSARLDIERSRVRIPAAIATNNSGQVVNLLYVAGQLRLSIPRWIIAMNTGVQHAHREKWRLRCLCFGIGDILALLVAE